MKDTSKTACQTSYEDIVEGLAEGVVAVDGALTVRVFNQSAEKICEMARTAVIGKPASTLFSKDSKLAEMLAKTLDEGRLFAEYEETLQRRFSGPLPVGITTSQIFDHSGAVSGAVALIKDLSGIKSLEAGSLRKDRLAYIGTFAASLAHEIKNPLSGIRGAAQLLSKKIKDEKLGEYTGIIIKEADRLDRILCGMLDFARPAKLTKKSVNIHKALDTVVFLTGDGLLPDAIKRDYDPSLPLVSADEGQLTQVFLNLVKNAKEAIRKDKDGSIRIITRMATEFHLIDTGSIGGKMALVEIKDNGSGIKPDELEKIFTPFFTTKPGGSGLGMAISLKIIKEHNGFLKIDSTPGIGTTISVYLPIAAEQG
ncbi:PAS domain-containing protein [bacterium]|nr:MAG: PAS domain-containing protein [bacterium]